MASEDQDILFKISQLAGKINLAKNRQSPDQQAQQFQPPARSYTEGYPYGQPAYRGARGGYQPRGYRGGRKPQLHRNRTLVLNSGTPPTSTPPNGQAEENSPENGAPSAWVAKNDRHLQLINTSVFEKESRQRIKAMEETRQQKLKQKDQREKWKINQHLQRQDSNYNPHSDETRVHEVTIQGVRFRVMKNGSKLELVNPSGEAKQMQAWQGSQIDELVMDLPCTGDPNAANKTPRSAVIGGVKFHRSKHGNLYRAGIINAYREKSGVKKIDELCKMFSTTGTCIKGPNCAYIHDASKVAVCKEFLQKGVCPSGDQCDLSHDLTPQRTPACLHFAKGNCSNPSCRYTHVRVSPTAPVCRSFGIYGYCDKGASCTERHVNECPDFSNTGTCKTKRCKLLHREKARFMRNNTALHSGDQTPEADQNSDVSSDDDEINSEDVDSDDLDGEFFGDDDGFIDEDIPMQQDYVQLS